MAVTTIEFSKRDWKTPSSKISRKVRAAMTRDGVVVLDGLFPMPLLRRIRAEVLRRHGKGELRERGLVRDIGGRCTSVLRFDGPFLDPRLYANPSLSGILSAILGPDHCLGSLETVMSLPGSTRQYQHVDGPLRFDRTVGKSRRGHPGDLSGLPPYALALAVPLCDVDEENGPTAIWPGSHREGLRYPLPSERAIRSRYPVKHMTGAFGRAYLYDYRTLHRGLPNRSLEIRPLLMLVFTRTWFRDPNLSEVDTGLLISKRGLGRIPLKYRRLFMFAPAARRT